MKADPNPRDDGGPLTGCFSNCLILTILIIAVMSFAVCGTAKLLQRVNERTVIVEAGR